MANDNEQMSNEDIAKLCQVFCEREIKVHINLKSNWFYNGYIREVHADYIMFNDDEEGELPIFFVQMFKAPEKYTSPRGAK